MQDFMFSVLFLIFLLDPPPPNTLPRFCMEMCTELWIQDKDPLSTWAFISMEDAAVQLFSALPSNVWSRMRTVHTTVYCHASMIADEELVRCWYGKGSIIWTPPFWPRSSDVTGKCKRNAHNSSFCAIKDNVPIHHELTLPFWIIPQPWGFRMPEHQWHNWPFSLHLLHPLSRSQKLIFYSSWNMCKLYT